MLQGIFEACLSAPEDHRSFLDWVLIDVQQGSKSGMVALEGVVGMESLRVGIYNSCSGYWFLECQTRLWCKLASNLA